MTHYGGLVLAQQFVRRFGVARRVDGALQLLKRHLSYHESGRVLALANPSTPTAPAWRTEGDAGQRGGALAGGAFRIPGPTTAEVSGRF